MRDALATCWPAGLLLVGFMLSGCNSDSPGTPATSGGGANAGQSSGAAPAVGGAGGNGSSGGPATGGASTQAGSSGSSSGGQSLGGSGATSADCGAPGLIWKSAHKTWYESYPDPGSEECVKYNGCTWAGEFSACDGKKPEAWVQAHNIVAAFPDFESLKLHDLCLRSGDKTLVVTVLDTCGDSDCDGCCTQNQGDAEQLIDLESYTNDRWGVEDGRIEWADLGPTRGAGCD